MMTVIIIEKLSFFITRALVIYRHSKAVAATGGLD
jgi:hypothetical protein